VPDLNLSHQETTNLGEYIQTCEVEKKVCAATARLLTDCEFRNECRPKLVPMISAVFLGLLTGVAAGLYLGK